MKKLTLEKQTKLHDPSSGVNGNCMVACIANYLGVKIEDAPPIEELMHTKKPNGFWWDVLLLWCIKMGYEYKSAQSHEEIISLIGDDFYFVSGESPRFSGSHHVVIYQNGKMVFDPHPDNTGILNEKYFEYLTPLSV